MGLKTAEDQGVPWTKTMGFRGVFLGVEGDWERLYLIFQPWKGRVEGRSIVVIRRAVVGGRFVGVLSTVGLS